MRILSSHNRNTRPNYGYLYNWEAVDDSRNITSIGSHIPTLTELQTLETYIGGSTIGGRELKEIGTTYWATDNGLNTFLFNLRGNGIRIGGSFGNIDNLGYLWLSTVASVPFKTSIYIRAIDANDTLDTGSGGWNEAKGIRIIKNSTTLTHGQTGAYRGNDGKAYRTICIGTQEWVADNLKETKYRDGSTILVVTGNTEWAALTTGARCVYDNDENNA